MDFIADLHIHSPFSRATSKDCDPSGLCAWARVKGIQVVASGDFTHPGWLSLLKGTLTPAEPGFLRLRDEKAPPPLPGIPPSSSPVRFVLSAEISCIYKRHGVVRKVHNLVYVPDFPSAERIASRLAGIGNIESDGRPILGLDSRNLLEIVLEEAPEGFLVPAHIWTPWFSLFGSKSGFDDIEECFGDLTPHVFALETGLSSDPDMNRLISALDRFALISNSDCHSPAKLGREANLFSTGFDFFSLRDALRGNNRGTFRGTIEFYPEEGKYHLDGHRACKVCMEPEETRAADCRCPVCSRPLTVGVLHRVIELADRDHPLFPADSPGFHSLVPLPEVLGEILGVGPASKAVLNSYAGLISRFGSEFNLLLHVSREEIAAESPLLAEAVVRIRERRVIRHGGYDGEFGAIRVFQEGEIAKLQGQLGLFAAESHTRRRKGRGSSGTASDAGCEPVRSIASADEKAGTGPSGPNPEQAEAVDCPDGRVMVIAGPGTGKTFTLTTRITSLITQGSADPCRICAITFTNRAADEVRERLVRAVGEAGRLVFVGTFHRFCLDRLRDGNPELLVIGPESRERLLKRLFPELPKRERESLLDEITAYFLGGTEDSPSESVRRYLEETTRLSAVDLDGVVPLLLTRLEREPAFRKRIRDGVSHLFVDEFQDLNAPQYRLIESLAENASVFAIGDPDQSIYGFRGSDPSLFFRFAAAPATRGIRLVRNYRSAPRLIEAASAVIAGNPSPPRLPLLPEANRDGGIELHLVPTPAAEAECIVRRIEELMGGISSFSLASGRGGDRGAGWSFGEMAILYRLSRQADELANALQRRGIPFQLVGATPYFLSPAARSVTRFVRGAAGMRETADWLALLRETPGIGETTVERLDAELPLSGDFLTLAASIGLPAQAERRIADFAAALERFREQASTQGISEALGGAIDFVGADPDNPDCARLLTLAGSFGADLTSFSSHLRDYAAETVYDERAEAVALMTLHAAKGLEFPIVFIAGCEEGLLPCSLWGTSSLEEERRLFYVGMTRARENLILTASLTRPWAGPGERILSRFASEIPEHLITRGAPAGKRGKRRKAEQMELF
jgi:uncharacterized protein (TIGR00375 family)